MDTGHSGQSLAEPANGGVRVGIVRPRQLLDSRQFKRPLLRGRVLAQMIQGTVEELWNCKLTEIN